MTKSMCSMNTAYGASSMQHSFARPSFDIGIIMDIARALSIFSLLVIGLVIAVLVCNTRWRIAV